MIGITANAAHVIANWGGGSVHRQFQDIICVIEEFTLYNSKGEYLLTQNMPGFSKDTGYMGKRSEFLKIMCDHVASLGIKIHRGKRITEFFETQSEAGIWYDGKRFSADCVLACDGVNSKARGTVLGDVGKPHPTGYATYRAWYDAASLKDDPKTQWIVAGNIDKSIAFIGPDVHCIFGTAKRCKEMTWVLTHLVRHSVRSSTSNSFQGFGRHSRVVDSSRSFGRCAQSRAGFGPESRCNHLTHSGRTTSVPKLHVRHLFGRVRPRTWRFEGFLDWTIIIF